MGAGAAMEPLISTKSSEFASTTTVYAAEVTTPPAISASRRVRVRPLDERMLRHHGGSAAQPATTANGVHVKASTGSAAAETPTPR